MKRAVIYLRVSTSGQADTDYDAEGYSIPAQRDACQRKAESMDATVVDEYLDRGETARVADRPAFQTMLERIKHHKDVDYVVVHKINRFARNLEDAVVLGVGLRKAGAQLVSAVENIDDSPGGRLLHGVLATIAEFESANLANEVLKGTVQKAKNGGTPFRAPLGYLNVRDVIDGRIIRTVAVDPDRAPLIRYAFEEYASGNWTLRALLADLTAKGLTSRPTPKQPEKPLYLATLADMLHNRYYMGLLAYRGIENAGRHEPLVASETFQRVQTVLKLHAHEAEKARKHPHYLKGTVYCARCEARLCITHAKGRYVYFFCLERQRGRPCPQRYVPVDAVEDSLIDHYAHVQVDPATMAMLQERLAEQIDKAGALTRREVTRQKRRLATADAHKEKLMHAYYKGAIDVEMLRKEQERIQREVESAHAVWQAAEIDKQDVEETLARAIAIAMNLKDAYREASPGKRKLLNRALFERVLVCDTSIASADLAPPFASLLSTELPRKLEEPDSFARELGPFFRQASQAGSNSFQSVFTGTGSNNGILVDLNGLEPVLRPGLWQGVGSGRWRIPSRGMQPPRRDRSARPTGCPMR